MQSKKLLQKIEKSYPLFLASIVTREPFVRVFPIPKIVVKGNEQYINEEQSILKKLSEKHEWLILNTVGTQKGTMIESMEFRDDGSYLRFLGKTQDAKDFSRNIEVLLAQSGFIGKIWKQWIARNMEKINEYPGEWSDIRACVDYFMTHRSSNLYFRELPIPVSSKFVERHRKLLADILGFMERETRDEFEAGWVSIADAQSFEERYGVSIHQ